MDTTHRLFRLFDYDAWSNRQVLDVLYERTDFSRRPEAVRMFHHILNAARLWFHRIEEKEDSGIELWPDRSDLTGVEERLRENRRTGQAIVEEQKENLDHVVEYTNSDGKSFRDSLGDLLQHVVIHGQHHRAQIARILREDGIQPPKTDFIFFLRRDH